MLKKNLLKKNLLGATGIEVSAIGLGSVKFGRNQQVNYPQAFALPTDNEIVDLLAHARALGINLLDTAPAYGTSEERLGRLLGKTRADWVICTKVGEEFIDGKSAFDFSKTATVASIERSLRRLGTDYLDIVLVHSNGEDKKIIEADEIFATLSSLKAAGKIRAYGMSTKTVEGGLLTLELADIVMVMHNPVYTDEQAVIEYAHKKNKGVLIKKALASGHLNKIPSKDPVLDALKFIFQAPGVSSVIMGTLNPSHLTRNIECARLALS